MPAGYKHAPRGLCQEVSFGQIGAVGRGGYIEVGLTAVGKGVEDVEEKTVRGLRVIAWDAEVEEVVCFHWAVDRRYQEEDIIKSVLSRLLLTSSQLCIYSVIPIC